MVKTYVPVNGDVVRWAIEESGLSALEAAEKVNVSIATLQEWIEGTVQPSQGEFTRLVQTLKRPSALFFAERIPSSSALPDALRSAPGRYGHTLDDDERRWVRRSLRMQRLVSFLGKHRGANIDVPRSSMAEGSDAAATRARRWLGVTVAEQVSWESAAEAWTMWRGALEHRGVLVFLLQLGPENIRGFSLWDDVAPVVAVNTAYNPQARIFTALHELGHLTLGSEAACADLTWSKKARRTGSAIVEERWCEEFAASVLMPPDDVLKFVDEAQSSLEDAFDLAREVAAHFKVSIRAAAIRLIRLDVEDDSLYALVNEKARVLDRNKDFARGRPRRRVQRRLSEYGAPAVNELILGSTKGLLNMRDLSDYLRVDTTEVDEITELLDVGG